jgi:energy-coupling factor transporter ATP-binding protein EcfA2
MEHHGIATEPASQAPALRLTGLHKQFGETTAVDHLDLTVPPGSFFGLVGPNGAGKTTALSMAVGLLRPGAGSARIFGVDVWADPVAAKRLIRVLPDGMALPERPTGRELLTYLGPAAGAGPGHGGRAGRRAAGGAGADRRRVHHGDRLLGRHAQEDHPGHRAAAHPEAAGARRAVRGDRPGVGGHHPRDPGALRRRRLVGGRISVEGLSWLAS